MSPLVETFGNASKRGWSVVSLGNSHWISYVTSTAGDNFTQSVTDASGNVYVTFRDYTTRNVTVLVKYTSAGVVSWRRYLDRLTIASPPSGNGAGVGVDSSGNVYLGSGWQNDYNHGKGVAKYDASGNVTWQRNSNDTTGSSFANLAVTSSGTSYAYGGNGGAILIRDSSGSTVASRYTSFTDNTVPENIFVDGSSNIYVCGKQGAEYNGNYNFQSYVQKFNSSYTKIWERTTNGQEGIVNDVAVDSSGNVYTVGLYGNANILKQNSSGSVVWNTYSSTNPSNTIWRSVQVDSADYIYALAWDATTSLAIIVKLDSSKNFIWVRSISGLNKVWNLSVDGQNNMVITGQKDEMPRRVITLKLPTDGSKTGTFSLGGQNYVYAAHTRTWTTYTQNLDFYGFYDGSYTSVNQTTSYTNTTQATTYTTTAI